MKGVPAGASQTPYAKGVVVVWTIIPPYICRMCPRVSTNSLFSFIKLVPAGVRSPGVPTAYVLCVWRVSCASAVVSSSHISRFRPIRCPFPPFDLPASSMSSFRQCCASVPPPVCLLSRWDRICSYQLLSYVYWGHYSLTVLACYNLPYQQPR